MDNTVRELVHSAKNPQEAMIVIAEALDYIIETLEAGKVDDGWGEWAAPDTLLPDEPGPIRVERSEDEVIIDLPSVTPEKMELRRKFARTVLQLEDNLPPGEDWVEAYAKGGPAWLYHSGAMVPGNDELELIRTYAPHVKQAMVADVMEHDPEEAVLMGRDLLKADDAHMGEWTRAAEYINGSIPGE